MSIARVRGLTLVNSGDKAQVAGATLLGFKKVGVRSRVGIDYGAVCENNFEIGHSVTCETVGISVEGVLQRPQSARDFNIEKGHHERMYLHHHQSQNLQRRRLRLAHQQS